MKSFTEVKYEFGVGMDVRTARDGDVVRVTFAETHGDNSQTIHVSMSALCARRAAILLSERATVTGEKDPSDVSLGDELARLRMDLERVQENASMTHAKLEDAIDRIKRMQKERGLIFA